jgi:hypothetical protein
LAGLFGIVIFIIAIYCCVAIYMPRKHMREAIQILEDAGLGERIVTGGASGAVSGCGGCGGIVTYSNGGFGGCGEVHEVGVGAKAFPDRAKRT